MLPPPRRARPTAHASGGRARPRPAHSFRPATLHHTRPPAESPAPTRGVERRGRDRAARSTPPPVPSHERPRPPLIAHRRCVHTFSCAPCLRPRRRALAHVPAHVCRSQKPGKTSARPVDAMLVAPLIFLVVFASEPTKPIELASPASQGADEGRSSDAARGTADDYFKRTTCNNDCRWENDGACDDGSNGGYAYCALGTDCNDCGLSQCAEPFWGGTPVPNVDGWTRMEGGGQGRCDSSGSGPCEVQGCWAPRDSIGRTGYTYHQARRSRARPATCGTTTTRALATPPTASTGATATTTVNVRAMTGTFGDHVRAPVSTASARRATR